jgi:hypothetical protein
MALKEVISSFAALNMLMEPQPSERDGVIKSLAQVELLVSVFCARMDQFG